MTTFCRPFLCITPDNLTDAKLVKRLEVRYSDFLGFPPIFIQRMDFNCSPYLTSRYGKITAGINN